MQPSDKATGKQRAIKPYSLSTTERENTNSYPAPPQTFPVSSYNHYNFNTFYPTYPPIFSVPPAQPTAMYKQPLIPPCAESSSGDSMYAGLPMTSSIPSTVQSNRGRAAQAPQPPSGTARLRKCQGQVQSLHRKRLGSCLLRQATQWQAQVGSVAATHCPLPNRHQRDKTQPVDNQMVRTPKPTGCADVPEFIERSWEINTKISEQAHTRVIHNEQIDGPGGVDRDIGAASAGGRSLRTCRDSAIIVISDSSDDDLTPPSKKPKPATASGTQIPYLLLVQSHRSAHIEA
ncbi:hypothetical protein B0H21DRAFT_707714 [Amylocystis lapponica]|nr:hypothetical protein B0H21DRAFT_707714 [Amylocystis lapponica]